MNKEKSLKFSVVTGITVAYARRIFRPLLISVSTFWKTDMFIFVSRKPFLLHSDDKLRCLSSKRQQLEVT